MIKKTRTASKSYPQSTTAKAQVEKAITKDKNIVSRLVASEAYILALDPGKREIEKGDSPTPKDFNNSNLKKSMPK